MSTARETRDSAAGGVRPLELSPLQSPGPGYLRGDLLLASPYKAFDKRLSHGLASETRPPEGRRHLVYLCKFAVEQEAVTWSPEPLRAWSVAENDGSDVGRI